MTSYERYFTASELMRRWVDMVQAGLAHTDVAKAAQAKIVELLNEPEAG